MKNLVIAQKKRTPEIIFKTSGDLSITGSSLPEDIVSFYQPILAWLEEFKIAAPKIVSLIIDLEYISTSSARIVLEILRTVTSLPNSKTTIIWVYEEDDVDMREQGEILQTSIKKPFEFLEKQINK